MALYSAKQLAAMLNVSAYTIQALIRAGEFGETVNVARQHLVTEDGLASFVAAHTGPAHEGRTAARPARRRVHTDPGPI